MAVGGEECDGQVDEMGLGVGGGLEAAGVGGEVAEGLVGVDEFGYVGGVVDVAGLHLPCGVELLEGFG